MGIGLIVMIVAVILSIANSFQQTKFIENRDARCNDIETKCNISQVGKNCTIALLNGNAICEYPDCIIDFGIGWNEKTCYFDTELNKCPTINCEVKVETDEMDIVINILFICTFACIILSMLVAIIVVWFAKVNPPNVISELSTNGGSSSGNSSSNNSSSGNSSSDSSSNDI